MTAQPVQMLTRQQFDLTPAQSVADFLRATPINNGISDSATTDEYSGGNSSINLRGVGARYTLVLVDGKRFGGEDTPDIGAVPVEAIEGIDILKSGASALYGSDAVAGVVNIRLREDVEGLEFHTSYGDATKRGNASHFRTSMVFGLKTDRF